MSSDLPDRTTYEGAGTAVYLAFVRHQASLKRFIARFLRNSADVDDIAQEAFLRAFTAERARNIEQPKSFVFRIAKHLALTRLARKSSQIAAYMEDSELTEVILLQDSAEDEVIAAQTLGLHCEAVAELPPQCRQVYLLRKVHGMSHKEVAAHLGIAISTVEKHLIKGVELCDRYIQERVHAKKEATRAPAMAGPRRVGPG
jgi:RNA polymerase sigma factor (sigma-70 family)